MSPYQHIFSTNTVLNVWRNLRANRDQNDLLLTFQYQPEDARKNRYTEGHGKSALAETSEDRDGRSAVDLGNGGRSIGFVVPWRSMQAQKRELREKEKELAEALVVLSGEVAFTDLPSNLQSSLSQNPLIQVRHLAAGLSRQLSKIELQMADNAPFARGKNIYTGGEIARRFLDPIRTLFDQRPVPHRMIFELLVELKDLVYAGMADCDAEVLEWELTNFTTFEDLDDLILKSITPSASSSSSSAPPLGQKREESRTRRLVRPKKEVVRDDNRPFLTDDEEILYHLESLETTASAMRHIGIDDFCAKSAITLRRMVDRRVLAEHVAAKKKRNGTCAEYARCMKWAGTAWRQGGGCRRGCLNEDEDPEGLPSWHSTSKHFDRNGTFMLGAKEEAKLLR